MKNFKPVLSYLLTIILFVCANTSANAQSIFDANFANFDFLAANKVHKVGTDGSGVGNVTLYTNVITISGQQIDCIVRTVSLSGGTFTLPGGAAGGTIPFDYSAATGTGMSANADRYFSPTFNWTAAGSCRFRFEFILGGSYNNGTNTGTAVILQNVYVNTYDVDGNGSANSNQNNEFGQFNTAQYKVGGNLVPTYNTTTGLTRFRSNTTTNTTAVIDDNTRLKIGYGSVSVFEVVVGADGGGAAYYFLDLGQGPAWTLAPAVITSPGLDLHTSSAGLDNAAITCNGLRRFTAGASNITGSSNAIDEFEFLFLVSDILDGNSEVLIPKTPAALTDSIKLGVPFSGTQSISLNAVTYNVTRATGGGIDTIRVRPVSGTFTTAQVETFLDSLRYGNIKPSPTTGIRNFNLTLRESFIKSVPATFRVNVDCAVVLPVQWLSVSAVKQSNQTINLKWSTAQEINTKEYVIQHSSNATTWNFLDVVASTGNSNTITSYNYTHNTPVNGNNYYRIMQNDNDGKSSISNTVVVSLSKPALQIINNFITNGKLRVDLPAAAIVSIFGNNGQLLLQQKLNSGLQNINVSNYPKGLYFIQSGTTNLKFIIE
jgi:hypothetical protein